MVTQKHNCRAHNIYYVSWHGECRSGRGCGTQTETRTTYTGFYLIWIALHWIQYDFMLGCLLFIALAYNKYILNQKQNQSQTERTQQQTAVKKQQIFVLFLLKLVFICFAYRCGRRRWRCCCCSRCCNGFPSSTVWRGNFVWIAYSVFFFTLHFTFGLVVGQHCLL